MGKTTRICSFDGCDKPHKARSLCGAHYFQWRAGKELHPLLPSGLKNRFWFKVSKDEHGGCWGWRGATTAAGYSVIYGEGRKMYAHRLSWELINGPIPDGMIIDHRCANRVCVNPEHLRAVTYGENNQHLTSAYSNNASGVRGVYWNKRDKAWEVRVGLDGKSYYGGYHNTIEAADAAARALRAQLHTHDDHDEWLRRNGRSA